MAKKLESSFSYFWSVILEKKKKSLKKKSEKQYECLDFNATEKFRRSMSLGINR